MTPSIYFGGAKIARREADGTVRYFFADHLGTNRAMTSATGVTQQESTYYPFGGEQREITSTVDNRWKFTSLERDGESGLDNTLFRKYASNLARWLSPDPLVGSVLNPQSLNRYNYVRNNPCNLIDPLGLEDCTLNVAIIGTDLLSGQQLDAAKLQVDLILQAASSLLGPYGGDSVGVNFNFSGGPDLTLTLTNTRSTPIQGSEAYPLANQYGSSADIYLNTIAANFSSPWPNGASYGVNQFSAAFGTIVGRVAAHEFGHYALGLKGHTKDLGIMSRTPAVDASYPPGSTYYEGIFPSLVGQLFTKSQADALFRFCRSKHQQRRKVGGDRGGGGWIRRAPALAPAPGITYPDWSDYGRRPPE